MASAVLTGCGYSEEEMQAQLDRYEKLSAQYQQERDAHAQAAAELEEMKLRVMELRKKLEAMGMNLDELSTNLQQTDSEKVRLAQSLEELQAALDEYKKRAEQLERIRARFDELRSKLQKLVELGLKVEIRHNRMVIRLPGDVLFASGKTELRDEGEEVIGAVADVIRKDEGLAKRYFQVAGHTDNVPLKGGRFGDNWGLSAMRAREVLVFLTKPVGDGGGGLDPEKLHAAGYADIDPIANNASPEGRQQNRRVELVVMPNVEEMLDLSNMADTPAPAEKTSGEKNKGKKQSETSTPSDDSHG